ncbi:MAG: hypothetical protein O2955_00770 [Planctomycetota bacterium]|nr:hypothetical protein [Planctomycetota bacterium]MDA1211014.1 hypothetical protein [Planctomycetota bacterium]
MGWLFGGKDWNVVAVIFEKKDLYRVNGNRAKGGNADKARDGAKNHARTLYWAVFDQKRKFVEGAEGHSSNLIPAVTLQKLQRDLATNRTVMKVLETLEQAKTDRLSVALEWSGYPKSDAPKGE